MKRNYRYGGVVIALLGVLSAVWPLRGVSEPASEAAPKTHIPHVTARLEPDSIGVGDRFELVIEVERDLVQVVHFPEFNPDSEVFVPVESCPVDTLERAGRRLKLQKRYLVAALDQGRFNLGHANVLYFDKNITDTLPSEGDSLLLTVWSFGAEDLSHSIHDLKSQKTLPFRLAEIRDYLWWGLLALIVLAGLIYGLHRYLRARGRRLGDLFRPAPPLPPHVAAIRALEALHHQKLWQNNRHKQYYSALTDILRIYISERWGVGAREMTSDEIITAMRSVDLPDKASMDLTTILRDADLVKFAKDTPGGEQNEGDYWKTYYFVEETKPMLPEGENSGKEIEEIYSEKSEG